MTKQQADKKKYVWVDPRRRDSLIRRVEQGEIITRAARDLDINYGNAKCIIRSHYRQKANPTLSINPLRRGPRFY